MPTTIGRSFDDPAVPSVADRSRPRHRACGARIRSHGLPMSAANGLPAGWVALQADEDDGRRSSTQDNGAQVVTPRRATPGGRADRSRAGGRSEPAVGDAPHGAGAPALGAGGP
jgi:hypothetical protein